MSKHNHKHKPQSNDLSSSTTLIDPQPSYQDIEALAYQIHEEKGGSDLDNWLEAERTLKERRL